MTDHPMVKFNEKILTSVSNVVPDFLRNKKDMGLENLTSEDFSIPQIKLIHPTNPEVKAHNAPLGQYWHTGLVASLGHKFLGVPVIARKRIILWRPLPEGGILAISEDGEKWDRGGDSEFMVKVSGVKEPVKWHTQKGVRASGLKNFGTMNPADPESQPAATEYFEYVLYILGYERASPVVYRLSKTGHAVAKQLNTTLMVNKVPIYSQVIEFSVGEKPGPAGSYFIPQFRNAGFVNNEALFNEMEEMHKQYSTISLAIEQESDEKITNPDTAVVY